MRFEWDEAKNTVNIRKHGIDLADAVDAFNHPMLAALDQRSDHGEDRWLAIGWIQATVCVVVFTERDNDVIRLISARKATRLEVQRYATHIQN